MLCNECVFFSGSYLRSLDRLLDAVVTSPYLGEQHPMRKFFIGAAIIWSGIWLIAGVLNTIDAIRIYDDLSRTLGAHALIDYWSGYWLVFLHVGALVWGL